MKKQLTSHSFIECWKAFVTLHHDHILENYDDIKKRTSAIIGQPKTEKENSNFGKFFVEYFSDIYNYRKEDGDVELSIFKAEFISGVRDMKERPNHLDEETLRNYPRHYDLLIEHENEIGKAYEEMHKLTYFRAYIKVLITYIWSPSKAGDKWEYAHGRLTENFSSIIKQTNESYPEHCDTSYILITGQKIGNELKWRHSIFWRGEISIES